MVSILWVHKHVLDIKSFTDSDVGVSVEWHGSLIGPPESFAHVKLPVNFHAIIQASATTPSPEEWRSLNTLVLLQEIILKFSCERAVLAHLIMETKTYKSVEAVASEVPIAMAGVVPCKNTKGIRQFF